MRYDNTFYWWTQDRSFAEDHKYGYSVVDYPDFGYRIQIVSIKKGFLPLFYYHPFSYTYNQYLALYQRYDWTIIDQYGEVYDWKHFFYRIMNFNGGGYLKIEQVRNGSEKLPISHLMYKKGRDRKLYYRDSCYYEFTADKSMPYENKNTKDAFVRDRNITHTG